MKLQEHRKLGSNMESCLRHAANGQSQIGLNRSEIISQKVASEKRAEIFAKFRDEGKVLSRVARVTRFPKANAFHVAGMGRLEGLTLNELKVKLGVAGYQSYRVGGFVFPLFQ